MAAVAAAAGLTHTGGSERREDAGPRDHKCAQDLQEAMLQANKEEARMQGGTREAHRNSGHLSHVHLLWMKGRMRRHNRIVPLAPTMVP